MTYLVLIEWRVTWWRGSLPLSVKRTETPAVVLSVYPRLTEGPDLGTGGTLQIGE